MLAVSHTIFSFFLVEYIFLSPNIFYPLLSLAFFGGSHPPKKFKLLWWSIQTCESPQLWEQKNKKIGRKKIKKGGKTPQAFVI
jgi:hypothetical protein